MTLDVGKVSTYRVTVLVDMAGTDDGYVDSFTDSEAFVRNGQTDTLQRVKLQGKDTERTNHRLGIIRSFAHTRFTYCSRSMIPVHTPKW